MKLHPNARLTPAGRWHVVQRVIEQGMSVRQAAEATGVSVRTVYKWLSRYRGEGRSGLADRSSRPHRSPRRTAPRWVQRIEQLRRRRKTAWEIAEQLALAPSTVSRILHQRGLGRLWRIAEAEAPPQRYEHKRPGSLVHIDAKKLGKIGRIGHRIHGDYRRRCRGIGWEVVFVCIDDCTRLSYAEVLPSENAQYATAFFRRALAWYRKLGIRVDRVLSDNAKCYIAKAFTDLCEEHQIRPSLTRPYRPATNGKAERFIQTLTRRWAYGRTYRTSALRAAERDLRWPNSETAVNNVFRSHT